MRLVIELLRALRARRAALRRTLPLAVSLLLLALLLPGAARAESSEWRIERDPSGEGWVLPWNVWVAGDVTLETFVPEHGPAIGEIDDVDLLARWEPTSRLALFSEVRLEDLADVVEGEGFDTGPVNVNIERLYAEGLLTPEVSLRLGKVFTPFGLWNAIHRAPFTWTVEEPAVADGLFPIRATGLALLYQTTRHGWTFDATGYGPAQDEIRIPDSNGRRGWLTGTRVAAGRAVGPGFASVGLNAAGFRQRDRSEWDTATGLDLDVNLGGHLLTGELTFRIPAAGGPTAYGFYLQDVVPLESFTPLARNLYGVLRLEQFQPRRGEGAVGGLVGLFWRPHPRLILRADYLASSHRLERLDPGLHGSISLLF